MKIEDLTLFVRVADQLSFTQAALALNLPQPTVSRKIKQLEDMLQVRLFERTSRQIFLTQQGRQFYSHCKTIVNEFSLAQDNLTDIQSALHGEICLCMPAFFNEALSKEFFGMFMQKFPNIRLHINILSPDQIEQNSDADLLFYIEPPVNSRMIAKRLYTFSRRFYASPSYLEKYGTPSHPRDLIHHNCLRFDSRIADASIWPYFEDNELQQVEVSGNFVSGSIRSTMQLAEQGHGICYTPQSLSNHSVREGKLVCLFNGKYSFEQPYYVMYHSRHHIPKKIRVFLDMITLYAEKEHDLFDF